MGHLNFHGIANSKLTSYIGLILYRISLDLSYDIMITYIWGYQGYQNDFSELNNYNSWLFLILLSPLIISTFRKSDLSSNILSVLILISLVPTTSLIAYSNFNIEFVFLIFIYWLLLLILNKYLPSINFKSKIELDNNIIFYTIIAMVSLSVIYISGIYTGFRLHTGIFDVYELRVEARSFAINPVLGYLSSAANNILPIVFIYLLIKKRIFSAIFVASVIILNFGIAGGKSVILLLFIGFAGYYVVNSLKKSQFFVWGLLLLVVLSLLEFKLSGTYFLSFFLTYRLMFLTSMSNYIYYDFFSTREFDYFRQSLLKWLPFESPYKDNIAFLLGANQEGSWGGRANNGLFSDAYSNLGPLGIFIFPFIVIILLKIIEGSTKGFNERLLFIITITTVTSLLSLTFSTSLLTGGIFLMIILFYSFPRVNNKI